MNKDTTSIGVQSLYPFYVSLSWESDFTHSTPFKWWLVYGTLFFFCWLFWGRMHNFLMAYCWFRFTGNFYGSALKLIETLLKKKARKECKKLEKASKSLKHFSHTGQAPLPILYILLQKESIFALSRKFEKAQNFFLKGFPVKWNPQ